MRPQPGELCAGWSQLVASQRTSVALVGAGLLGGRGWVKGGFLGVEEGGLEEQEEGVGGGGVRGAGGGGGEGMNVGMDEMKE